MTLLRKSIFLILFTIFFTSCNSNDIEFDSKKWKNANNNEENWSLRWDMSNDLINNHSLIGKDTTEIFELLGKTNLEFFKYYSYARYALGPCRTGINDGTLTLVIVKGKVTEILKNCN